MSATGAGDISRLEASRRLLLGLFESGDAFRQWVAFGPDGAQLVANFPGSTASFTAMVTYGLDVLSRRGYLDGPFFDRLTDEFPRRSDDIAHVAAAWRIAPVPVTASGSVTQGGIVPVATRRASAPASAALEIELTSGEKIRVPHGFDSTEVARLVEVVRGCGADAAVKRSNLRAGPVRQNRGRRSQAHRRSLAVTAFPWWLVVAGVAMMFVGMALFL